MHSLREFLAEATEVITHADSRLWRTIYPLLFRPGFLTREFLRGRRARYLPPFRLYIVASVLFFLIASLGSHTPQFIGVGTENGVPKSVTLVDPTKPEPGQPAETPEQRARRYCDDSVIGEGSWLDGRIRAGCRKIVIDGGRGVVEALYHNIPRGLIVLLPLLALVMRIMYLRRYYVEHLLFFIHNHAFTFVFLIIYTLLLRLLTLRWFEAGVSGTLVAIMTAAMILLVPYYTYRAMLRVYGQGKWITRFKFVALSFAYLILVNVLAVIMSIYTLITL
jgi:ABC-type multidrug transport system fused ATPase/permease subunit